MSEPFPIDEALLPDYQKLRDALAEANTSFRDDEAKGIVAALDAVIGFVPAELAEPLQVLRERLEDEQQRERGNLKNLNLAVREAIMAAAVDWLRETNDISIVEACKRVAARSPFGEDWNGLKNLRNRLRKKQAREEATAAYWHWLNLFKQKRPPKN